MISCSKLCASFKIYCYIATWLRYQQGGLLYDLQTPTTLTQQHLGNFLSSHRPPTLQQGPINAACVAGSDETTALLLEALRNNATHNPAQQRMNKTLPFGRSGSREPLANSLSAGRIDGTTPSFLETLQKAAHITAKQCMDKPPCQIPAPDCPAVASYPVLLPTEKGNKDKMINTGPWTAVEHALFLKGLSEVGPGKGWKDYSMCVRTRTTEQTRSHGQKYLKKQGAKMQQPSGHRLNSVRGGKRKRQEEGADSISKKHSFGKKKDLKQSSAT